MCVGSSMVFYSKELAIGLTHHILIAIKKNTKVLGIEKGKWYTAHTYFRINTKEALEQDELRIHKYKVELSEGI